MQRAAYREASSRALSLLAGEQAAEWPNCSLVRDPVTRSSDERSLEARAI